MHLILLIPITVLCTVAAINLAILAWIEWRLAAARHTARPSLQFQPVLVHDKGQRILLRSRQPRFAPRAVPKNAIRLVYNGG
jgi:hypothetical protein